MAFIKSIVFAVAAFVVVSGFPQFALPDMPVAEPTGQLGGIQNQTSSLPVGGEGMPVGGDQQLPGGVAMPGGAPGAEGGEGGEAAPAPEAFSINRVTNGLNGLSNSINNARPSRH